MNKGNKHGGVTLDIDFCKKKGDTFKRWYYKISGNQQKQKNNSSLQQRYTPQTKANPLMEIKLNVWRDVMMQQVKTRTVRITKDVRYQNWKLITLDCRGKAVKGYFFRYHFKSMWIYYSLWKDEIPLKDKELLNKNSCNNTDTNETTRPIPCETKVLGDVDELIFPDDEAYYISER